MVFVSLFPYVVSVSLGFPYMESISLGFPHVVMLPRHLNVFTPLFWIQHCYELLWTLHCSKGRCCDVTIMRTDLRGSPSAAIVDCQSIYYLLDFKRICFIFPWNNSTYDLDATVGWLVLGYSINARVFGPLTPYLAVGLAGITMCTRVNNYLWNHVFCHFKASLFLFQLMFVLDTVDSRYLAPVGSQNSRARVKWFSRYLALSCEDHDSRIQDHRPTLPGVYNSLRVHLHQRGAGPPAGAGSVFCAGRVFTLARVRAQFHFTGAPFRGTGSLIYKYQPINAPYSCGSRRRIAPWAISAGARRGGRAGPRRCKQHHTIPSNRSTAEPAGGIHSGAPRVFRVGVNAP